MKSLVLIAGTTLFSVVVGGCSFAARSPEMYRDDTKAVLETKNNDIRACYDGVLKGAPTAAGKARFAPGSAAAGAFMGSSVHSTPSSCAVRVRLRRP
jgi:hypothetical protein